VARYSALTVATARGTAVVACDHATGRRRVLRHGDAGFRIRIPRPALVLGSASAGGHTAAWVEARLARGRIVETLWTVDLRRGGRSQHRVVARARDRDDMAWTGARLGAAVVRDGTVSWLATTASNRSRVVIGGASGRTVTAGGPVSLAVEDGRTVRWRDRANDYHYVDVVPVPEVDGCPRRSAFRHQAGTLSTPDILVTYADYDPFGTYPVRACLRATGRDPVVVQNAEGSVTTVAAANGPWILLARDDGTRYSCTDSEAYTLNLRTLRKGRASRWEADLCDGTHAARLGFSVVTAHGVPAWISTPRGGVPTVFSVAGDRTTVVLGRGAGSGAVVSDLRVDGDGFSWVADGVAQHAKAP
jgi:hypothetical protein